MRGGRGETSREEHVYFVFSWSELYICCSAKQGDSDCQERHRPAQILEKGLAFNPKNKKEGQVDKSN
jgi:hypothetical protein